MALGDTCCADYPGAVVLTAPSNAEILAALDGMGSIGDRVIGSSGDLIG